MIFNLFFSWVIVLDFRFDLDQGWIAVHELLKNIVIMFMLQKTDFLFKIQNEDMFYVHEIKPSLWGSCHHPRSLWTD